MPSLIGVWHMAGSLFVGSFVGSFVENDNSVTITLRGHCDTETTERVRAHLDAALGRGARFVTVEILGPLDTARGVCALLARTQTLLASRRGLLVVHGLHPDMLDGAGPHTDAGTDSPPAWQQTQPVEHRAPAVASRSSRTRQQRRSASRTPAAVVTAATDSFARAPGGLRQSA